MAIAKLVAWLLPYHKFLHHALTDLPSKPQKQFPPPAAGGCGLRQDLVWPLKRLLDDADAPSEPLSTARRV